MINKGGKNNQTSKITWIPAITVSQQFPPQLTSNDAFPLHSNFPKQVYSIRSFLDRFLLTIFSYKISSSWGICLATSKIQQGFYFLHNIKFTTMTRKSQKKNLLRFEQIFHSKSGHRSALHEHNYLFSLQNWLETWNLWISNFRFKRWLQRTRNRKFFKSLTSVTDVVVLFLFSSCERSSAHCIIFA